MELIKGARNKTEQKKIEKALGDFIIVWPADNTCNKALTVFSKYYLSKSIGIIDSLIGQMAVDLNYPLCTFNKKHYEMIPGIKTLQPYKK